MNRLVLSFQVLVAFAWAACATAEVKANRRLIAHPDDSSKRVEYFLNKPEGKGPWPAVIFLHGHQMDQRPGGKDFVTWGVLDRFAKRGYLSVAVSQPGYGGSTGPADFCGLSTQHAVSAVIKTLRNEGSIDQDRIVIEGISRGALVASLIAGYDSTLKGIVLISGVYDLPQFLANPKSNQARLIAQSIVEETGGGLEALRARSALQSVQNIKAAALIMNGAKDDRTDPEQARRLATEINSRGGKARVIVYPEYGHNIPVGVRDSIIDSFIDDVLVKQSHAR